MKVDIQDVNTVTKNVTVTFPKDDVENGLKNELQKIAKVAQIKGFRKGKAPFSMVEKLYMPEAMERYADKVIKESLKNIVEENNFDLATTPVLKDQKFSEDGFLFDVMLELHPKVELKNYKGLTFNKKKVSVTDEEVDAEVKMLVNKYVEYVDKGEDVVSEDKDRVEVFVNSFSVNGEEKGANFHETIDLSKGETFPDIKAALIGAKIGEKKEVVIKYPDNLADKNLASKEGAISLEVRGIKKPVYPSNDELAEKEGFKTFEELTNSIKEKIKLRKTKDVERDFRTEVFSVLAKENPFEVPASLVNNLAIKMAEDLYETYRRYGLDPEQLHFDWNVVVERYIPEAENSLKQQYLIRAIREAENIDVTEEEIEEKLGQLLQSFPDKEKVKYFNNHKLRESLYLDLLNKKVFDFIISQNSVVEE